MGTNYYAVRNRPTTSEPIHIGKSSAGWLFSFQSHNDTWAEPPVVWNTYRQVKEWLKKHTVDSNEFVIINEYDDIISFEDFCKMVDDIQADPNTQKNPYNFTYNRNVDGYRFTDEEFW